ncbi:MAG: transposase [Thaumarchaeota archaeon]|nr:transposase [Nitrososphaerota archaeon]
MLRAYKFRFYPDAKQSSVLVKTLNSCCFLYNSALQERKYAYEARESLRCNDQINELPQLKKTLPEYREIYSQVLQDVLQRLDKAFNNFFGRVERIRKGECLKAGYPRFKPSWRYNSFTYPQSGFHILPNGHIELAKIGRLRVFIHRAISGRAKTLTVKRDSVGDWFVIISTELHLPKPKEEIIKKKSTLAIDVGIKNLVTLSTGEYVEPPQFFKRSEERLKRMQRELSAKKIGSNNRAKARVRLAWAHRKIERQRNDFLHKLSKALVDKTDLLVFENLQIPNMVKNHGLAKSIHDASWSKLIQLCSYKASSAGKSVELVDPRGTTQTCSGCGSVVRKSLSERVHRCPTCGLLLDRDLNAALNILSKIGRGTPELTPVGIRPLLIKRRASRVREAGSPCL